MYKQVFTCLFKCFVWKSQINEKLTAPAIAAYDPITSILINVAISGGNDANNHRAKNSITKEMRYKKDNFFQMM